MLTATMISGPAGFDWCSTQTPQAGCSPPKDICLPMTPEALQNVQSLQRMLNQLRAQRGAKLLCIDGRVGPATRAAVVEEVTRAGESSYGYNFCDNVMNNIRDLLLTISMRVSDQGAPDVPDPACSQPPSVVTPSGGVYNPPLKTAGWSWGWTAAIGIAVAGTVFFVSRGRL